MSPRQARDEERSRLGLTADTGERSESVAWPSAPLRPSRARALQEESRPLPSALPLGSGRDPPHSGGWAKRAPGGPAGPSRGQAGGGRLWTPEGPPLRVTSAVGEAGARTPLAPMNQQGPRELGKAEWRGEGCQLQGDTAPREARVPDNQPPKPCHGAARQPRFNCTSALYLQVPQRFHSVLPGTVSHVSGGHADLDELRLIATTKAAPLWQLSFGFTRHCLFLKVKGLQLEPSGPCPCQKTKAGEIKVEMAGARATGWCPCLTNSPTDHGHRPSRRRRHSQDVSHT